MYIEVASQEAKDKFAQQGYEFIELYNKGAVIGDLKKLLAHLTKLHPRRRFQLEFYSVNDYVDLYILIKKK